jgi:glycosyltransferase involved in cell wall biosynthesis
LDVQALQVEGWADRGVGRYIVGYSAALARRGALAAALLAPELPPPAGLPNDLVSAGGAGWDTAATCRKLMAAAEGSDGGSGPLVHHLTAPFLHAEPGGRAGLGGPEHWARSGVPRVVLLHDLIPLRAPRHYLPQPGAEERYRARAEWVGAADLIVTNSEHTRAEALDLLGCDPARVATIGVGVLPFFCPPDGTDEELWQFHFGRLSGRPHLVTVGGSDARKGTDRAIAALGLLVTKGFDLSLLVVGHLTAAWQAELETTARACGVAERVFFAGAVDDELLRACYRRAVATVMPSLAEGAGLPVLESAASGTPALASGTTALAETAAHPAALFDPTDVGAMAEVIGAAVDSPERRTAIRAAQQRLAAASTWDAVADRAVAAMAELVGSLGAGPSAPPWPFRLVLVGWPPLEDDLLGAISRAWRGEVEVVVAGPAGHVLPSGHRAWPGGAFGTDLRPASYDGVVYVLTGAASDDWVLEQAGRFPGWLWVWDAALPLRFAVDAVVRRSRGVLVAGGTVREAVRLALRPLAALPPLVVVPAAPAGADDLVAAVRP